MISITTEQATFLISQLQRIIIGENYFIKDLEQCQSWLLQAMKNVHNGGDKTDLNL